MTVERSTTSPSAPLVFHPRRLRRASTYVNVLPGDSLHFQFVARGPARSCTTVGPRLRRCI